MDEIFQNLFYAVLTITIPALSGAVASAVKTGANALAQKAETDQQRRIIAEIAKAIVNAVSMVSQTYVDVLKAAGKFDEAAQKEALNRALEACVASLSDSAYQFIQNVYGDPRAYLTNQIEAEVKRQKLFFLSPVAETAYT